MEQHMKGLGRRVHEERKLRGWTAEHLAEEAGVAANTVGRIEAGRQVRDGNLRKVLDALAIQPEVRVNKIYPDDIELLLAFVGEYLEVLPKPERRDLGDAIVRLLATHRETK